MSGTQLDKEIEKIENELRSMPRILAQSRLALVEKTLLIQEFINNAPVFQSITQGVYSLIEYYAGERALLIENSQARLNLYDIASAGDYSSWTPSYQTPTATQWIFYAYTETGDPLTFDPDLHYFIAKEDGSLAKATDMREIIKPVDESVIPEYTITTPLFFGVPHNQITLGAALPDTPALGERFALMSNGDLVGYGEVGTQGLGINPNWDFTGSGVDPTDNAQMDSWFSGMMNMAAQDFFDYTDFIIDDDVTKSADPNRSSASDPVSRIEESPFFPALTTNQSSWPDDFDTIDTTNRADGSAWAVYPKFRWEGKLTPTGPNPNSEDLPMEFFYETEVNAIQALSISTTEFPVNGSETSYRWRSSDDKVVRHDTGVPVDCKYNSVTDLINLWDNGLGGVIDWIDAQHPVNTWDTNQQVADNEWLTDLQELIIVMDAIKDYHGTWFEPSDDGNTLLFNSFLGVYDVGFVQDFKNELNLPMFSNRLTDLESAIGNAETRTGLVGDVIRGADLAVNKNFGIIYSFLREDLFINTIKENLQRLKKKYDAYSI